MKTLTKNKTHTPTLSKVTNSWRLITLALLSLCIFSCEGEDGEMGPEGLQGDPGTANVIYSEWVNTGFDTNITNINASFDFDAPEINASILNFGTILVYGRDIDPVDGAEVYQLPFTYGVGSTRKSIFFIASSGKIRIRINSAESIGNGGEIIKQYRYVIIPGGQAAKSSFDYKNMSYSEIQNALDIPAE